MDNPKNIFETRGMLINSLIKAKPYEHQIKAFNFAVDLFGVDKGGDAASPSGQQSNIINHPRHNCAFLMEM